MLASDSYIGATERVYEPHVKFVKFLVVFIAVFGGRADLFEVHKIFARLQAGPESGHSKEMKSPIRKYSELDGLC